MGPAIFFLLVVLAVLFMGFTIYGMFLGLGTLGGYLRRFWLDINAMDSEPALATAGGPSTGGLVAWQPSEAPGSNGEIRTRAAQPLKGCWDEFKCPESIKEFCAAYKRPELPCWLAQMEANGDFRLKPDCLTCKLFNIPALMTGV